MNKLIKCFLGGNLSQESFKKRSYFFRPKFNILSFLLCILVLSLIYQIITGLYGLFLYNRRLKKGEMLLQEKLSLIEDLEVKIQGDDVGWSLKLEAGGVNKEANVSVKQ